MPIVFARRDKFATAPPKRTNYRACATDLGLEYAHFDVDEKRIKRVFSHVATRVPPHRSNGQNIVRFAAGGLEIRIFCDAGVRKRANAREGARAVLLAPRILYPLFPPP